MTEGSLIKEINRIFYDIDSCCYDKEHPEILSGDYTWWQSFAVNRLQLTNNESVIRVLDVGSGTGFIADLLTDYLSFNVEIVCYDLSQKMLDVAREKIKRKGKIKSKVFYVNGEAEVLPFKDQSFDVITCNSVLHHLSDCSKLLSEVKRVLKANGLFAVSHEHNNDFFKFWPLRLLASIYKTLGAGFRIDNNNQDEVNRRLKAKGLIAKSLTEEQIMKLVEWNSPVEQSRFSINPDKGFSPKKFIDLYFKDYDLLELSEYSTFFHRPFLEKNRYVQTLLKFINRILFKNRGVLFRFIVKK
ncbi:MAG: class I SAM-dependent methyltransferase [Candidatus Omnitrophica bacterium]|nr:class I SAM-dependent methyltransferase [Candidatus Omnitrophota bacterium]